jgi:hypothetical protein
MTHSDSNNPKSQPSKKEADKYGGVVEFDMSLTPSVIICGAAGAVLGAILAMWVTTEIPIIIATVIVFAVLSAIFGFFVPWYKPQDHKK